MKALTVTKSTRRFAAAKLLNYSSFARALEYGPLALAEIDPPKPPTSEWLRLKTRMCGICGSDISSLMLKTSRYFEAITSFPFTPGHEVVADLVEDGSSKRVVIEPALTCAVRGTKQCIHCAEGQTQLCESITIGTLDEGIQTGYCASTGGGWSQELVAHPSQLWVVPEELSDEDAVMVEPLACAIHAALRITPRAGETIAILGAGTVGLATLAALRALHPNNEVVIGAKYQIQRNAARKLGASLVMEPSEVPRLARRRTHALVAGRWASDGFDYVFDCVASSDSLEDSILMVKPGGTVILTGMPGKSSVDLAPLWHREVTLVGSYAYGVERLDADTVANLALQSSVTSKNADGTHSVRTFAIAVELMRSLKLGWMVTNSYTIDNYEEALVRAQGAGSKDAIKVVFDLRPRARLGSERTS